MTQNNLTAPVTKERNNMNWEEMMEDYKKKRLSPDLQGFVLDVDDYCILNDIPFSFYDKENKTTDAKRIFPILQAHKAITLLMDRDSKKTIPMPKDEQDPEQQNVLHYFALEYSEEQNGFHVHRLYEHMQANITSLLCGHKQSDWSLIGVFPTLKEYIAYFDKVANYFRPGSVTKVDGSIGQQEIM
jgi:hypothetical protein